MPSEIPPADPVEALEIVQTLLAPSATHCHKVIADALAHAKANKPAVDVAALRAMVCRTIAALGESLDALTLIHEIQSGPGPVNAEERAANIALTCEHLAEAFSAADQAALNADDYSAELSRLETKLSASQAGGEG